MYESNWQYGNAFLEVSSAEGLDLLAADAHGHRAAWAKRFGGPDGTGFVSFWGRDRRSRIRGSC